MAGDEVGMVPQEIGISETVASGPPRATQKVTKSWVVGLVLVVTTDNLKV